MGKLSPKLAIALAWFAIDPGYGIAQSLRVHHPPPAEATAACNEKMIGANCSFVEPSGDNISGRCYVPKKLTTTVCIPTGLETKPPPPAVLKW